MGTYPGVHGHLPGTLRLWDEVGRRHDVYNENAAYGYHFITITYQAL